MLHSEVVPHLVSYRCSDNRGDFAVIHRDTARELKSADRTFQGLANDSAFEDFSSQKLSIIVRVIFHEVLLPVVEEAPQRLVTVARQIRQVLL